MKFVVVLVALVAFTSAELDPKLPEYMLECSTEFGIDLAIFEKEESLEKIKDEKNFKCFMKCLTTKLGFVTPTGELSEDKIRKQVGANPLTDDQMKTIKECTDKQKQEEMCDRISSIADCIYNVAEAKP